MRVGYPAWEEARMAHLIAAVAIALWAVFAGSGASAKPSAPGMREARIGWVSSNSIEASALFREALLAGFAELGYTEGRNLALLSRYADDKIDAVAPLAQELVRAKVDVLIA